MSQQIRQKANKRSQPVQKAPREAKYSKPHMIIPVNDAQWILSQPASVHKLWQESWICDPYGSRWMPLTSNLSKSSFKRAKRVLTDAGLFIFENRLTITTGDRNYEWWVKNLHGSRSSYWQIKGGSPVTDLDQTEPQVENLKPQIGSQLTEVGSQLTPQPSKNDGKSTHPESLSNASVTSQKHFSNSLSIPSGEREGESAQQIETAIAETETTPNTVIQEAEIETTPNTVIQEAEIETTPNTVIQKAETETNSTKFSPSPKPSSNLRVEDKDFGRDQKAASRNHSPAKSLNSDVTTPIDSDVVPTDARTENSEKVDSLSIPEDSRESFLKFARKKAEELPRPPVLVERWISKNFSELYKQFCDAEKQLQAYAQATEARQQERQQEQEKIELSKSFYSSLIKKVQSNV